MNKHLFNILDDLQVSIEVTHNPFDLPLDLFFKMAARINKKRSFLFVSKILGKHLAVNPYVSLLSGAALGMLYQEHTMRQQSHFSNDVVRAFYEQNSAKDIYDKVKSNPLIISEPTLFIGFAETATALGHSMFDIFAGPTKFLHTTRDRIVGLEPSLSFEEEHSHATAHNCYALDSNFFSGEEPVVLVDDEITTGKTALNIIRDLHTKHPRSRYVIASLLDWRSEQDITRFHEMERELGISITCLSLIRGQISVSGSSIEPKPMEPWLLSIENQPRLDFHHVGHYFDTLPFSSISSSGEQNNLPFMKLTGRFGMNGEEASDLDQHLQMCSDYLHTQRSGERTLCMGTGEFMYIPMRIAAGMGQGVSYLSSTRSPIHPHDGEEYAIQQVYPFDCPEDSTIANFFYNVSSDTYDEIFVFVERETETKKLASYLEALQRTGVPVIHFVHFTTQ